MNFTVFAFFGAHSPSETHCFDCSFVSAVFHITFRPQLCIDVETRLDCGVKAPTYPRSRPHNCVYSPLRANATPILPNFFHIQFFVQNCKHRILRYACGLNYFAHFDSSITQCHIVDFVNHFGGSHFHWTSRTMFIFCRCTTTFKLIYLIVNSCKHRSRCAMNFIQSALISFGVKPFKYKCLITARNPLFPVCLLFVYKVFCFNQK